MKKDGLSIIIITLNRCDELKKTLYLLKEQVTNFDWEVVICDQNSNDGTEKIVKKIAEDVKPYVLNYLKLDKNYGVAGGRNIAIKNAKYNNILSLDDDANPIDNYTLQKVFDTVHIRSQYNALAVSSFAQFYFGVVNGILITADQKGYLKYNVQTITLIVNTLVCVLLLKLGATIQMVKLSTSLIYLLRPIYLCFYVKENYDIDRKIILDEEPIKQKKNGFAQHLAAFITGSTDTIILTLFSGLTDVSVYSVYFLVINGLKQLIESLTSGIQVLLGKLWAENNIIEIKKYFFGVEWLTHFIVTIVFGATLILIIPFVLVYTQGINDVNYYVPAFSVSITFAYWIYCLRIPYNMMILVSGHYRETQKCFITSAIINIVSSVILVKIRGLVGVALGTMVAMIYQIVWLLKYNMKNIVLFGKSRVIRQLLNDVIISGISIIICLNFDRNCGAFSDWVKLAVKVVLTWIIISIIVNFVFFKKYIIKLYNKTIRKRHNFE